LASCFHLRRDLFFDAVRRTLLLHLRQHAVARGPPDRFAHREDSRGDVFHRLGLNFNGVVKAFDGANNVRVIALGSSFNVYGLGTNSQMGVFTARDTSLIPVSYTHLRAHET